MIIKIQKIKTIFMECWLKHPFLNDTSLAPQLNLSFCRMLASSFVTLFTSLTIIS